MRSNFESVRRCAVVLAATLIGLTLGGGPNVHAGSSSSAAAPWITPQSSIERYGLAPASESTGDVLERGPVIDGGIRAIAHANGRIYAGIGADLVVFDGTRDAMDLLALGRLTFDGQVIALAVDERHAFVMLDDGWLVIIDVSRPMALRAVSRFDPFSAPRSGGEEGNPWFPSSVMAIDRTAVDGRWLYVAVGHPRGFGGPQLITLDISDRALPFVRSTMTFEFGTSLSDIIVMGGRAYVAVNNYGGFGVSVGHLLVLDMSDRDAVKTTQDIELGHEIVDLLLPGPLLYVAATVQGERSRSPLTGQIHVFGVSRPGSIRYRASRSIPKAPSAVGVQGSRIYVATHGPEILAFDISALWDESPPSWRRNPPGIVRQMDLMDDRFILRVADSRLAIVTLDGGGTEVFEPVGTHHTLGEVKDVDVVDALAAVVAGRAGTVSLFDVSDVGSPVFLGGASAAGAAEQVVLDPPYIYTGGREGVRVFQIDDTHNVRQVGFVAGSATSLQRHGSFLYDRSSSSPFFLYDVTDPTRPTQVRIEIPFSFSDMWVLDGEFWFQTFDYGRYVPELRLVPIADDGSPLWADMSMIYLDIVADHVMTAGPLAFLLKQDGSFRIIDRSDPGAPVEIARHSVESDVQALDIDRGYLYVTGDEHIQIYDVSALPAIELVQEIEHQGQSRVLDASGAGVFAVSAGSLHTYRLRPPLPPSIDLTCGVTNQTLIDITGEAPSGPALVEVLDSGSIIASAEITSTRYSIPLELTPGPHALSVRAFTAHGSSMSEALRLDVRPDLPFDPIGVRLGALGADLDVAEHPRGGDGCAVPDEEWIISPPLNMPLELRVPIHAAADLEVTATIGADRQALVEDAERPGEWTAIFAGIGSGSAGADETGRVPFDLLFSLGEETWPISGRVLAWRAHLPIATR